MQSENKATRIRLLDFTSPQMRAFHMSWFAFFLCFFAWFGIAPLMSQVKAELSLTPEQVGWTIIGSVSITVVARLFIGWLCDRIGPRYSYTGLLIVGSLPVMGIGLADDFASFLAFRIAIGVIGASFVITQYHTSLMFASNCVGTANATTAGWGNLGGGVTQVVMPLLFLAVLSVLGCSESVGWRVSMFLAGTLCFATGIAYFFLTQDTPDGNFRELRAQSKRVDAAEVKVPFLHICADYRVWVLFLVYGACFGIELTINNTLASYFSGNFEYFQTMDTKRALAMAGLFASLFGLMNLFARTLGGYFGDRFGDRWGLKGRVKWLFFTLFFEGLALMLFAQMTVLVVAIPTLIVFSLFVQMSEGATYSVVPFVNKRAIGIVSGIVGAGGNAGAMLAGFLFKTEVANYGFSYFVLGGLVTCCAFLTFMIHFTEQAEVDARTDHEIAVQRRNEEIRLEKGAAVGEAIGIP